jgi:hypothetical protein
LLFAEGLVRNDPFLRNRPKVLDLTFLDEAKLVDLCARFGISMFGRPQALAFGIPLNDDAIRRRSACKIASRDGAAFMRGRHGR